MLAVDVISACAIVPTLKNAPAARNYITYRLSDASWKVRLKPHIILGDYIIDLFIERNFCSCHLVSAICLLSVSTIDM